MTTKQLNAEWEQSYQERKKVYDLQVESLEMQRKAFYEVNPDCPNKTLFMNVCAPPLRIEFREIKT